MQKAKWIMKLHRRCERTQRSSTLVCGLLAMLVVPPLAGCQGEVSRNASVSGTVLIDSELAEGGTITFHPTDAGPPAVGRIHADGSYSIRTGGGNLSDTDSGTLNAGEYKVTIVVHGAPGDPLRETGPPTAGPLLTNAKYASVETSDLERTVKPGENLFVFEIEGAAAEQEQPQEQVADDSAEEQADSELADDSRSDADAHDAPAAADETSDVAETEAPNNETQPQEEQP